MKRNKKYQYPWRYNNRFTLLVDGDEYFTAMLESIDNAKHLILFETYLAKSGFISQRFVQAFCAARQRGVRTCLILDEFGCKELAQEERDQLAAAGVDILFYHPVTLRNPAKSLHRDHRKLLCVDHAVAYIGGAGLTDEFMPETGEQFWHDIMLKVEGTLIADMEDSFSQIWNKYKSSPIIQTEDPPTVINSTQANRARLLLSAGTEKNEILRALVSHIRNCKNTLFLTSPYFITSWKLRRALRHAAHKGVDVRLLLPGPHSDHPWITAGIQHYYHRLLKAGIRIFEYQPRFSHAKIIVCDDWLTLGSSNLDRWNQLLNLDANIEIHDTDCNHKIRALFHDDFQRSCEIRWQEWKKRPVQQLIKEKFAEVIITVLGYIGRKFRRR